MMVMVMVMMLVVTESLTFYNPSCLSLTTHLCKNLAVHAERPDCFDELGRSGSENLHEGWFILTDGIGDEARVSSPLYALVLDESNAKRGAFPPVGR